MRLLFVSNLYPPNVVGGYERLCSDVAAGAAARGHSVSVLTSCYGHARSRHAGQVVHQALQLLVGDTVYQEFAGSAARRNAISLANRSALRAVVESTKPDKIFCWNLYGLDQAFLDTLLDSGVPVTAMLTDNWLAGFINPAFVSWYFQTEVSSLPGQLPARPENRGSVHLPCDAIFGARYMRTFYELAELYFANNRVIHNGVESLVPPGAFFRDRRTTVRPDVFSLLFAGRLVHVKGLQTAIAALPALNVPNRPGPRFGLTVVGDDRDTAHMTDIRALVAECGVTDAVTFRPPVREDELFDLFQSHDAYVFPSLYEPFSLTLIHALAAGIPTVASDVGGNVEIVEDGRTGLLFGRDNTAALADCVRRLVDDPALRCALSTKARRVAAGFTFDAMMDGILNFLAD